MRIIPQEPGEGYVFEKQDCWRKIPREYIPAADKEIREAMTRGVIAGYPVVDIKIGTI